MNIIQDSKICDVDEDLVYCEGLAYQKNMDCSVQYGKEYFEKYIKLENTQIADDLNRLRINLTKKYCSGVLFDIGIGSGEFIKKSRQKVYGYDINPFGVKWLKKRNLFLDPYARNIPDDIVGWTFWDVLEHMKNPADILDCIPDSTYVFVSIPIFKDILKVKMSKHYRPNEHYYYFTEEGLVNYMKQNNLECLESNENESLAGRESIMSFVFLKQLALI